MAPAWTPRAAYGALRNQLGSVRSVYLGSLKKPDRQDDFGPDRRVVLLLHGFFQTRNIFEVLENRLRHDGYAVMSFNLGGLLYRFNTHPIDKVAALIAEKVEGLADRHGFERVHVIGHSKGGLVGRRWVQHLGGVARVRSLITLGTPHHGTPTALAAVGLSKVLPYIGSAHDMLPSSPLVEALNLDHFPAGIPLTSIYSRADAVCPWWCSVLRPREGEPHLRNVEVPRVGHSELCWDPRVYRAIRDHLRAADDRVEEGPMMASTAASR